MRRIKISEGGVADPVTGKIVFPEPPLAATLEPSLLNSWQEELSAAIESSGQALDETKRDQLWQSLRKPGRISAPLTITVAAGATPSATSFTTLQAALDSLVGRYIEPGVEVIIDNQIPNTTLTVPLVVSLTQGNQVTVRATSVGTQSASNPRISFTAHQAAGGPFVVLKKGCSIKFENINFYALSGGTAQPHAMFQVGQGSFVSIKNARMHDIVGSMLIAEDGGVIDISGSYITGCVVPTVNDDFHEHAHGLIARRSGVVKGFNTIVDVATKAAWLSERNGHMTLSNCHGNNSQFEARHGASMYAIACVANGNNKPLPGFYAHSHSSMRLIGCVAGLSSGLRTDTGYYADMNSFIFARGCTAYSDNFGFIANGSSTIDCRNTSAYAGDVGYAAFSSSTLTHNNKDTAGTAPVMFFPAFGEIGADLNRTGATLDISY